ncbi:MULTISPECIES: exonuclease domain-containing protein [Thalassospira]|uniref:DNA polymerase III n=2 Tax=Thalassospira TaxID=168934 RepID=A0A367WCS0_9PROT|nr:MULTISPECIES: exonuclease domain-containing protein [Thalassospira]MDG4719823.1 exonuclease domain-containing protein [Thalassospira sp. FZY0004]RCK38270.1 DNA polymerase III [Thalassospira profundimaris]
MGLRQKIIDSQIYRDFIQRKATGPLRTYYDIPPADPSRSVMDTEFIALDLETTGLDPKRDEIVSLGWVIIRQLGVDFSSCEHVLVRPKRELSESSVVVHHIFDSDVANAPDIGTALEHLLPQMAGRVLISHHAPIELGFLGQACKRCFGAPLQIPTVDTLVLALRDLHRSGQPMKSGALKLDNLRRSHNLPPFRAHNALSDAIAASGLFLAQIAKRDPKGELELNRILR